MKNFIKLLLIIALFFFIPFFCLYTTDFGIGSKNTIIFIGIAITILTSIQIYKDFMIEYNINKILKKIIFITLSYIFIILLISMDYGGWAIASRGYFRGSPRVGNYMLTCILLFYPLTTFITFRAIFLKNVTLKNSFGMLLVILGFLIQYIIGDLTEIAPFGFNLREETNEFILYIIYFVIIGAFFLGFYLCFDWGEETLNILKKKYYKYIEDNNQIDDK